MNTSKKQHNGQSIRKLSKCLRCYSHDHLIFLVGSHS